MDPVRCRGVLRLLDPWLYRHPFEGASARRYAGLERCGFGELDERLAAAWRPELAAAARVLDVGSGPGTLGPVLAARYPGLAVIGVEPSADFAATVRGRAEALPLATGAIDVATCVSSIRHVRDRDAALRELRRVVRPGGACFVVELDPAAPRARWREHTRRLGSRALRVAFVPLVLRTAPTAEHIARRARAAGWRRVDRTDDAEQPVYILRLT